MAAASIPVNLFNPGQVFACLGFLEVADMLLGDAEGGFDWTDEANVRFRIRVRSEENAFAVVLRFLARAEVYPLAPSGYSDTPPTKESENSTEDERDDLIGATGFRFSGSFPNRRGDRMALPIRFESSGGLALDIGHWADGSNRNDFKLYAGNRSAHSIACAMLRGTREKTKTSGTVGAIKTLGLATLWDQRSSDLIASPFDVLTGTGGSFNFDPRGGWTGLDAGYSPNVHSDHWIAGSPVVEILAACGLEHARPEEYETRKVRYGAWCGLLPPLLARPALGAADVALPVRRFRFELIMSGKNKVVTFAREERTA